MAEVMNEVNNSIGKLEDNNDTIKLNGDTSDPSGFESEGESGISDPQSKDSRLNRKYEINNLEKVNEQTSISEKPSTLANGHLRSERTESDHEVVANDESQPNEADTNVNVKSTSQSDCDAANDEESSKPEGNSIISQQISNSTESGSSTAVTISHTNDKPNEGQVLNLTTTHSDGNISVREFPRTEGGLSITVVPSKSASEQNSKTDGENGNMNNGDGSKEHVLTITSTPEKHKKYSKKSPLLANITPRRSSRNLNKHKNYNDKDVEIDDDMNEDCLPVKKSTDDDDIEEVTPTDPLADDSKSKLRNKTIVVSDTKGLVEFATNARASKSNKKEPTLVIIDTKSILSGRGPIPVSQSSGNSFVHSSGGSAPIPVSLPISASSLANTSRGIPASTSAFSVIPIGLPAQGLYSQYKNPPPQMKPIVVGPASTTVTPISIQSSVSSSNNVGSSSITAVAVSAPAKQQPPIILPSLTDDMFVVEAPSFIVPYVYEKPPMKALKEYLEKIEGEIKEAEEKKKEEREKELAEEREKELAEKVSEEVEKVLSESSAKEAADGDKKEKTEEAADEAAKVTPSEDDKAVTDKAKATSLRMEVDGEESNVASKTPSDAEVVADSSKTREPTSVPEKKDEAEKKDSPQTSSVIDKKASVVEDVKKSLSYFDNPLGKFFIQIGLNLVQEHVQTDLLRTQKRKRDKEGENCSVEVQATIVELTKTLESSKENNDPFKLDLKKCELCSFKTESLLVMAHHLETPHMKNYTYRCNFCPLEVRSPHDILFHMEAEHNVRGRLERAPAFHQCANCPFEDNQKGKLTRHMVSCLKKYRPERNQEPPLDWEPPAKIPRVTRNRPPSMSPGNAVYQAAMSGLKQVPQNTLLPKLIPNAANMKHNMVNANKRPNAAASGFAGRFPNANTQSNFQQRPISMQNANQGMLYRASTGNSQTQVLLPQNYQLPASSASLYQSSNMKQSQQGLAAAKLLNQPSISITPLPRQSSVSQQGSSSNNAVINAAGNAKAGKQAGAAGSGNKNSFVVCEICDGYIKDLEQLRNHMQWIHKVKIHPKMIYNRPPLNCQKCQFRFFTDQGLERHLLGSHGLVTSSMQEAANKGKDGGRCPVCGRVYQWKLLNHVARDHQMALKPAHLSYKCTVCTATFGMYKQFESHVYSAHSVVAKRAMDAKKPPAASSSQSDALLKPLKINDEITIIPQPVRLTKPPNKMSSNTSNAINNKNKDSRDKEYCARLCVPQDFSDKEEFTRHVLTQHVKPFSIKITRFDSKPSVRSVDKKDELTHHQFSSDPIDKQLRLKYQCKSFQIRVTKLETLREDFVYKVMKNKSDEFDVRSLIPEVVLKSIDASYVIPERALPLHNSNYRKSQPVQQVDTNIEKLVDNLSIFAAHFMAENRNPKVRPTTAKLVSIISTSNVGTPSIYSRPKSIIDKTTLQLPKGRDKMLAAVTPSSLNLLNDIRNSMGSVSSTTVLPYRFKSVNPSANIRCAYKERLGTCVSSSVSRPKLQSPYHLTQRVHCKSSPARPTPPVSQTQTPNKDVIDLLSDSDSEDSDDDDLEVVQVEETVVINEDEARLKKPENEKRDAEEYILP